MSFYENDARRVRHHLQTLDAVEAARVQGLDDADVARAERAWHVRRSLPSACCIAVATGYAIPSQMLPGSALAHLQSAVPAFMGALTGSPFVLSRNDSRLLVVC